MSDPLVICFTGRMGSGKTTRAKILQGMLCARNLTVRMQSFAAPVKFLAHMLGGALEDGLPKKSDPTPFDCTYGQLYQKIGEAMRRAVHDRVWISIAETTLLHPRNKAQVVIFDDLRYSNEAAWCKARGGVVVRCATNAPLLNDGRDNTHPSEIEGDSIAANFTLTERPYPFLGLVSTAEMYALADCVVQQIGAASC